MNITEAGTTLVLSDTTPEEKKRILSAIKQPTENKPRMLTRKQVGEIFNIHPLSCKRWEKSGKLKAIRITPRTVRYSEKDVLFLMEGGAAV